LCGKVVNDVFFSRAHLFFSLVFFQIRHAARMLARNPGSAGSGFSSAIAKST
jgi:hypothetical protein